MFFYIVDDNRGTVKTLENIVESESIGEVIGWETDSEKAVSQILTMRPDIVLVDLLMDNKDGVSLVKEILEKNSNISFVMISRVSDKEMVAEAYEAGVKFFIHKPINFIEVKNVLKQVVEKKEMENMVKGIKNIVQPDTYLNKEDNKKDDLNEIKTLLSILGMMGEKGTDDILAITQVLIETGGSYSKEALEEAARRLSDNPLNMEQRVRRLLKKGLTNMANIGLEDYSSDIFQNYANYVFDFKNVKEEMDNIKGLSAYSGRVKIKKFIDGLITYRELENRK